MCWKDSNNIKSEGVWRLNRGQALPFASASTSQSAQGNRGLLPQAVPSSQSHLGLWGPSQRPARPR